MRGKLKNNSISFIRTALSVVLVALHIVSAFDNQNAQEFGDRKQCGRLPAQEQPVVSSCQVDNSSSVSGSFVLIPVFLLSYCRIQGPTFGEL